MDSILKPGKAVPGFGIGTQGTCDHEIGPRYIANMWVMVATAAAGQTLGLADFCGDIATLINGKPQRIHSAVQLDVIQGIWGADYQVQIYNYAGGAVNYAAGVPQAAQVAAQTVCFLTQWFAEPWRKTWAGAEMFGWLTSWQDGTVLTSFQTQLTGGNTGNVTAGSLSISAFPIYDGTVGPVNPTTKKGGSLYINKWSRNIFPYTAAGVLPLAQGLLKKDAYQEIRCFMPGADTITYVKSTVNGKTIRDNTKWENDMYALGRGAVANRLSQFRLDLITICQTSRLTRCS